MILTKRWIEIAIKAILIGFIILSSAELILAQQAVNLTNGSIIKGVVVPTEDSSKVKVQTSDGSQWVFSAADVASIKEWEIEEVQREWTSKKSGFYNVSDLGMLFGNDGVYTNVAISAQTVSGYRFNQHWSAGIGLGLESFSVPLAPIFLEGRYHLLDRRFSPFVAIQGGYGVPLENYMGPDGKRINKGGVMLNPMIGIKHQVLKNVGLVLSAGYRHQQSISTQYYWWFSEGDTGQIRTQYNRLVFRVGLIFS
jgi:hypothetical protein